MISFCGNFLLLGWFVGICVGIRTGLPVIQLDDEMIAKPQLVLHSKVRMRGHRDYWKPGGPCRKKDIKCMSTRMLVLVNRYRDFSGVGPLRAGTLKQLDNAMKHSRAMKRRGKIYHQQLRRINFGCGSSVGGENVALNHASLSDWPTDPAWMCVKQFWDSPPHRKNLLNPSFDEVVMGVLYARDGYMWCTETFARRTKYGPGRCAPVGSTPHRAATPSSTPIMTPTPSTTPTPRATPSTAPTRMALPSATSSPKPRSNGKCTCRGHQFRNRVFIGRFPNGRKAKFTLRCRRGVCRYCMFGRVCLSVEHSISIDEQIEGF